jgi:hypothetical protein
VPRASGKFNIPPTAFSYFDISSSAYKTIYSDKIELSVSPASASSDLSAVSFARNTGGNGTAAKVEQINRDINYIKTGVRSPFSAALIYIAGLDIINYISVALILIAGLILIIEASGFEFSAKKSALRRAKKDLTRAKNMTMISQALSDYLGRRQGYPIGIMTIEDVADNLKIRGAARKELLGLWDTFEMLKYAPSSAKTDNMAVNEAAQKTLKLIQKLEKEIK